MKIIPADDPLRALGVQPASGRQTRDHTDTFFKILEAAANRNPEAGNIKNPEPLDKEMLLELIRMLRLQMSQHLVRVALLGGSESSNPDINLPGTSLLNLPLDQFKKPAPVSNNEPVCEKKRQPAPPLKACVKEPGYYDAIIGKAASENDLDPDLIRAVIKTESGFRADAVSAKGAKGLMQLMPGTARDLGVKNPFDPEENIKAGSRYLKGLLDRYDGDRDLALAAYNWGMGNVERKPGRFPRETLDYIARVNRYYQG